MFSYPSPASSWDDVCFDEASLLDFYETPSADYSEDCGASNATGSRKRKQAVPRKSPPFDDPDFRGVTFTMENRRVGGEWRLVIDALLTLSPRRRRCRRRMSEYIDSADEDDVLPPIPFSHMEKHCASCSVKKTPLWRDAEDGTPLCNACGIRYKKYKVRCGRCWHIPKKDEFSPTCKFCGACFQFIGSRN